MAQDTLITIEYTKQVTGHGIGERKRNLMREFNAIAGVLKQHDVRMLSDHASLQTQIMVARVPTVNMLRLASDLKRRGFRMMRYTPESS